MADTLTLRTCPQWPWLVGWLGIFILLLDYQIAHMAAEEMPLPVLSSVMIPAAVGWIFVGLAGLYVLLFSVRHTVVIEPEFKILRRSTWVLGYIPIHVARREFEEVRYVRIGLESTVSRSFGDEAAGCLIGMMKRIVMFVVFSIWAVLVFKLYDPDSSPAGAGIPVGQIVFNDRDAWIVVRGSEAKVEAAATLVARTLGVRLGG